jgi:DNA-directed RNA polymerase specialized sigma24 family protein
MLPQTIVQSPTIINSTNNGKRSGTNKLLLCDSSWEFIKISDEELCRNAQQGCAASRDILWHRFREYIQRIVHKENKRHYLPEQEIADALQELYFAFYEAVQQYHPESHCKEKPTSFKTFLGIVVAHSFSEYCGRWRKYHRRVALGLDGKAPQSFTMEAEDSWHISLYPTDRSGCSSADWKVILLSKLSSDGLAEALRRLKPKERELLEVWLQYGRDKDVAQIMGISPAAARLRRERLFRRIKQGLNGK